MWRRLYNADWERTRQQRLRSMFVESVLSPIHEEPRAEESEAAGERGQEEGPLPDLAVEHVPRRPRQDEPEEYYNELEKKIRNYLKRLSTKRESCYIDVHDSYDLSNLLEVPSETNDTLNEAFFGETFDSESTHREDSSVRASSVGSDTQSPEQDISLDKTARVSNESKSNEIDEYVLQRKDSLEVSMIYDDSDKSHETEQSIAEATLKDVESGESDGENIENVGVTESPDEQSDGNLNHMSNHYDTSSATSPTITSVILPLSNYKKIDKVPSRDADRQEEAAQSENSVVAENTEENEEDDENLAQVEDSKGAEDVPDDGNGDESRIDPEEPATSRDGEEKEFGEELDVEKYNDDEDEEGSNKEIDEEKDLTEENQGKGGEVPQGNEIEDEHFEDDDEDEGEDEGKYDEDEQGSNKEINEEQNIIEENQGKGGEEQRGNEIEDEKIEDEVEDEGEDEDLTDEDLNVNVDITENDEKQLEKNNFTFSPCFRSSFPRVARRDTIFEPSQEDILEQVEDIREQGATPVSDARAEDEPNNGSGNKELLLPAHVEVMRSHNPSPARDSLQYQAAQAATSPDLRESLNTAAESVTARAEMAVVDASPEVFRHLLRCSTPLRDRNDAWGEERGRSSIRRGIPRKRSYSDPTSDNASAGKRRQVSVQTERVEREVADGATQTDEREGQRVNAGAQTDAPERDDANDSQSSSGSSSVDFVWRNVRGNKRFYFIFR